MTPAKDAEIRGVGFSPRFAEVASQALDTLSVVIKRRREMGK